MRGLVIAAHLFTLQSSRYYKEGDPLSVLFGIVLLAVMGIAVFVHLSKRKGQKAANKKPSPALTVRQIFQLAKSEKPKPPVMRHFKRKQMNSSCSLNLVSVKIVKEGRKKSAKLIVENHQHEGILQDISIGGCAIGTSTPVQKGATLKIDFHSRNSLVSVLGQVLRLDRSPGSQTILHVKFIKVPLRAFNEINSLVFGYG